MANNVWKDITAEAICNFSKPQENGEELKPHEIGVKKYIINHGLKEKHPLNYVKFFDKKGIRKESYSLINCKKESMLPKENCAWTVRCYSKPLCDKKLVQTMLAFEAYCKSVLGGVPRIQES